VTELDAPTTGRAPEGPTDEEMRALYRALLLPRVIEEKMLALLRRGQLSKWFSGIGQEAVSVGLVAALRQDDWILPAHRNLGVFTGRNFDLDVLLRQLLGREGPLTGGRDRTFHFGDLDHHVVGMISHLGAMVPVATGLALAARLRGEDRVAAVLTGDGASSEGDVHEAMNLAAVWKLPVLFVIENNQWGLSTPVSDQYACVDLVDRAAGYGMPGELVDGNDVLAVRDACERAAARGRAGKGPTLLECKTFRMRGHEEASGNDYVPAAEIAAWVARDPIERLEARLDGRGLLPAAERAVLREELRFEVENLVSGALAAPAPATNEDDERARVYAAPAPLRRAPAESGPDSPDASAADMRYVDAVRDALRVALAADDRVVLLGQDIAGYGGVFKATEGLVDEFGAERVRNTPIIESGAIGAALGLALAGFRPVVEMQFGDFVTCGFNQLVNNVASTRYRWNAAVPLVVRLPVGGVLEHKRLYRSVRGPVPEGHHVVPIGAARIARSGTDATIVTYGAGVDWAASAADASAAEGAGEVEVIDLRSLRPWDRDLVLDSVRRTSRVLVLHEAGLTGGLGAEIAATIADEAFMDLDAPVRRVGGLDTPIPFAPTLEAVWSADRRLLPALRDLLAF
jgi:2-oxoisovalerate dehydrogenase E1 component